MGAPGQHTQLLRCDVLKEPQEEDRGQGRVRIGHLRVLEGIEGRCECLGVLPKSLLLEIVAWTYAVAKRGQRAGVECVLEMLGARVGFQKRDDKLHVSTRTALARDEYIVGDEVAGCLLVERQLEGGENGLIFGGLGRDGGEDFVFGVGLLS